MPYAPFAQRDKSAKLYQNNKSARRPPPRSPRRVRGKRIYEKCRYVGACLGKPASSLPTVCRDDTCGAHQSHAKRRASRRLAPTSNPNPADCCFPLTRRGDRGGLSAFAKQKLRQHFILLPYCAFLYCVIHSPHMSHSHIYRPFRRSTRTKRSRRPFNMLGKCTMTRTPPPPYFLSELRLVSGGSYTRSRSSFCSSTSQAARRRKRSRSASP